MPYSVRKSKRKGKPYAIVNTATGRVAGHSSSKRKAHVSAGIRNRSHR